MPLVLSDAGIARRLDAIRTSYGNTLTLALFVSNIVPSKSDVAATYTAHEASFGNYARQAITTWGSVGVASHAAGMQATPRTFTRTGGATESVYGYFVLDAGGLLQFAEAFPAGPVVMSGAGQTLTVVPVMSDESKYP